MECSFFVVSKRNTLHFIVASVRKCMSWNAEPGIGCEAVGRLLASVYDDDIHIYIYMQRNMCSCSTKILCLSMFSYMVFFSQTHMK